MKKQYKHFLVGGCSFSSDGIGGTPPTDTSVGGCSYNEDPDYPPTQPGSWAGMVGQQLGAVSLVNTAASSHGNMLIANSILECINKFQYSPAETLVLMNITEPCRLDLPCAYDHPEVDHNNVPWSSDLIPYSYFERHNGKVIPTAEKNIGLEQVEQLTSNSVEFLFTFLESHSIDFYFLTMTDFSKTCLNRVLNKFNSHYIPLIPGPSMYEYCQQTKTYISEYNGHPNNIGHKQIADIVCKHINDHANISM
jgi:hypothetical protein